MACELLSHRTSRAAPVDRCDRIKQLIEVRCVASTSLGAAPRRSCGGERRCCPAVWAWGGACVGRRRRPRLEALTVLSAPTALCHAAVGSRSRGARRFEQGVGFGSLDPTGLIRAASSRRRFFPEKAEGQKTLHEWIAREQHGPPPSFTRLGVRAGLASMTGLGFGTLLVPVEDYRHANLHERILGSLHGIPSPLLCATAGRREPTIGRPDRAL